MLMITEENIVTILTAFDQDGELSAAIELQHRSPSITTDGHARLRLKHRRMRCIAYPSATGKTDMAQEAHSAVRLTDQASLWRRQRVGAVGALDDQA